MPTLFILAIVLILHIAENASSSTDIFHLSAKNTTSPFVQHADIVKMNNLKHQKNSSYLQDLVKSLNNSFGIIMKDVSRKNKKKRTEYLIQHLVNSTIKAGIKRKYLQRIPNIYIHHISNCNLTYSAQLWYYLISNPENRVLYISSVHTQYMPMSIRFNAIYKLFEKQAVLRNVVDTFVHCLQFANKLDISNRSELLHFLSILHVICDAHTLNITLSAMQIKNGLKLHQQKYISKVQKMIDLNLKELRLQHPFILNRNFDENDVNRFEHKTKRNVESALGKLLNIRDPKKGKEYVGFWRLFVKILLLSIADLYETLKTGNLGKEVRDKMTKFDFVVLDIIWSYDHYNGIKGDLHIVAHNFGHVQRLQRDLAQFLDVRWNIHKMYMSNALTTAVIKQYKHC